MNRKPIFKFGRGKHKYDYRMWSDVMRMHRSGMSGAEIDRSLGLEPDTAHKIIVSDWTEHGRMDATRDASRKMLAAQHYGLFSMFS